MALLPSLPLPGENLTERFAKHHTAGDSLLGLAGGRGKQGSCGNCSPNREVLIQRACARWGRGIAETKGKTRTLLDDAEDRAPNGFREETRACQVRASLRSGKLVVVEAK